MKLRKGQIFTESLVCWTLKYFGLNADDSDKSTREKSS